MTSVDTLTYSISNSQAAGHLTEKKIQKKKKVDSLIAFVCVNHDMNHAWNLKSGKDAQE